VSLSTERAYLSAKDGKGVGVSQMGGKLHSWRAACIGVQDWISVYSMPRIVKWDAGLGGAEALSQRKAHGVPLKMCYITLHFSNELYLT
jgi:hypothetical protein